METDLLEMFEQASEWTVTKVAGAQTRMDAATPCDEWDVRTLMNHMLDTQRYFLGVAQGDDTPPPSPTPPQLLGDDPVRDFDRARSDNLRAFAEPGILDRTGPSLGIAFSDQLLHGWDLAQATRQDSTMPPGLARAAYDMIHGRFTDAQRPGIFKPEIAVPSDASDQDKLLAYTGRDPNQV